MQNRRFSLKNLTGEGIRSRSTLNSLSNFGGSTSVISGCKHKKYNAALLLSDHEESRLVFLSVASCNLELKLSDACT
ncbi:Hypothetical predicted protein [Cloeon dipterum]|uniref:Uncharacterized protein n=1 Tax=Cloeon dipterum TaxID=197152 RepID=A0A8S1CKI1_9INSE|nr:Hypothetical predicted protein [Cloeon dipterum]